MSRIFVWQRRWATPRDGRRRLSRAAERGLLLAGLLALFAAEPSFADEARTRGGAAASQSGAVRSADAPVPATPQASAGALAPAGNPSPASSLPDFPGAGLANSHPPFLTGVAVEHADGLYEEGDELRLQFLTERESHLYLLYHQANGESLLLFPNVEQRMGRIAAKRPVQIPDAGQKFKFRIQPPLGDEVLQVLACLQPVPELDALIGSRERAPGVSRELLQRLSQRLKQEPANWTEHRGRIRTVARSGAPVPRPLARVGLFIGVGGYPHLPSEERHDELRHSAEVFQSALHAGGGVTAERTKKLLDGEATRDKIEQAITGWLASASRPGDTVIVYFSGSLRQPRGMGTAADGKTGRPTALLLPVDFQPGGADFSETERIALEAKTSIADTALMRWLSELTGRTIVLVLDTVQPGGTPPGSATGGPTTAAASPAAAAESRTRMDASVALREAAALVRDVANTNVTVLMACSHAEPTLFESLPQKTLWFTSGLVESLRNPMRPRPLTVLDAHQFALRQLKERLPEGHPARRREPLFLGNPQAAVILAP